MTSHGRMTMMGIAALLLSGWPPSHASMSRLIEQVCPIDGETFAASEVMSGTSRGRYLDLAYFGAVIEPPPLPMCPKDGFVVYQKQFSSEETTRLRRIVGSKQYQAMRATESNHYLAAWLRRAMGEPEAALRYTLLQATWEVAEQYGSNTADPRYPRYATKALGAYQAALAGEITDKEEWLTDRFVAGELARRLGRFDEARKRFELLQKDRAVADKGLLPAVRLELQLINSGDSWRHAFPDPEPGRTPDEQEAQ